MALTKKQADALLARAFKAAKQKPTRGDLLSFIEWATERAKELEPITQGEARDFLVAVGDDGAALLKRCGRMT